LFLAPRWVMRAFGSFIAFLWVDLFRIRRKVIDENLKIAFPEWDAKKRNQVGRTSVYQMGWGFFEILMVPFLTRKWLEEEVVFEGEENYRAALAKGKGVLVMSLHLGNGDLGSSAVVMKGYPLTIITKIFKNPFLNDLWFEFRSGQGVKYIDAHGTSTSFDILKTLKRQEGVVFVVDQFMGRPFAVVTTFFGRETGTAYGLALFALKTKAPVVPIYAYRDSQYRMHVVFEAEIPVMDLAVDDKNTAMVAITQRFNDKIESIVRKHPEQWMWVHRRWKDYE
jgi:KDO2-lipid IV(A) lauroyltransferase